MISNAIALGRVEFPPYEGPVLLNMVSSKVKDFLVNFPERYHPLLQSVTSHLDPEDHVFVTIDEREVVKGTTHRHPGIHIDGNYFLTQGWRLGGYWGTDTEFQLSGGMIIASTVYACDLYIGIFEGAPSHGGDCRNMLDQLDSKLRVPMDANIAYMTTSTCVHNPLPVVEDTVRQLLRITLNGTKEYPFEDPVLRRKS